MKKWECTICGYIHEGDESPGECPICGADKNAFVEVKEEATSLVEGVDFVDTATAGGREATAASAVIEAASVPVQPQGSEYANPLLAKAFALILQHQLHPISVHTPNGVVPMAVVFLVLAALWTLPFLESAAFYSLVFVLLSMPVVLFTGYAAWQKRYRGIFTSFFKIKIGASLVATLCLLVLIIWRAVDETVVLAQSNGRWAYLLISFALLAAVGVAGHFGGKLVFGGRKG